MRLVQVGVLDPPDFWRANPRDPQVVLVDQPGGLRIATDQVVAKSTYSCLSVPFSAGKANDCVINEYHQ